MSYSRKRSPSSDDSNRSPSPKNTRSNGPGQGTLFEFFKKKSIRDLDRSFASAKRSRRQPEPSYSPNVKLLKDLNTSPSPQKSKRTVRIVESPPSIRKTSSLRQSSPIKMSNVKLNNSRVDISYTSESRERYSDSTPLFIKLLKSGNQTNQAKKKPNVPLPNTVPRRLSASFLNNNNFNESIDNLPTYEDEKTIEEFSSNKKQKEVSYDKCLSNKKRENPYELYGSNQKQPRDSSTYEDLPSNKKERAVSHDRFQSAKKQNESSIYEEMPSNKKEREISYDLLPSNKKQRNVNPYEEYGSNKKQETDFSMYDEPQSHHKQRDPSPYEQFLTQSQSSPPVESRKKSHSSPLHNRSVNNNTNEIKLFRKSVTQNNSLAQCMQDYEYKQSELGDLMQRQIMHVNRISQLLQEGQHARKFDLNEVIALVEDLGLTIMASSRVVNEGLFDAKECLGLFTKEEQRHKQEIQELTEALDQTRSSIRVEKQDYQGKLEELLSYIGDLKLKQHSPPRKEKQVEEDAKRKQREKAEKEKTIIEMERLRENIRQLTTANRDLEENLREITQENKRLNIKNTDLKETQEIFRKEIDILRSNVDDSIVDKSRERSSSAKKDGKEKKLKLKSRQSSPLKGSIRRKSSDIISVRDEEIETLKREVEYWKYKAQILTKENEDVVRNLTDKILIERENKMLSLKYQEAAEGLMTKNKENENLWRAMQETKEKLGRSDGYAIFASTLKQYGLDDKPQGKLIRW